jgi:hypothetical protein
MECWSDGFDIALRVLGCPTTSLRTVNLSNGLSNHALRKIHFRKHFQAPIRNPECETHNISSSLLHYSTNPVLQLASGKALILHPDSICFQQQYTK